MRPSPFVLLSLVLASCGPEALRPDEVETVLDDPSARVTMTLIDRGGFPDRVVDYDLVVQAGAAHVSVMHGHRQAQSVSRRARAVRRGEMIVVALLDEICLVDGGAASSACITLDDVGPDTRGSEMIADAIAWRATDTTADEAERARAAIALAWVDPGRGLVTVRAIDVGTMRELDAELAGTLARLTHDHDVIDVLRVQLGAASTVEVLAIARSCVPELAQDVAAARSRLATDAARTDLDAASARCALSRR